MKKITRFSVLVAAMVASMSMAYSQATIDFETVGGGNAYFWAVFQNGAGATDNFDLLVAPIANPSATGINTSANCLKFIEDPTAAPWGGLFTDDITGGITFTAQNCFVRVMVYKTAASPFGVKFEGDIPAIEKLIPNTKINEWEELTFDFSSEIGKTYKRLVILPDFANPRVGGSTNYFDNISFGTGTVVTLPVPTVAAPTPTATADNVISLFSNAYTNVSVSSFRTDWSSGALTDLQIAGNDTKKYSGLGFVGIETTGTLVDASAMLYVHFDVWTPNLNEVKFKLVDFGANGVWEQGGDNVEHEITVAPTKEVWNRYHVALTDFTGLTTKAHLAQYIISGLPSGIAYIDNLYFSKVATAVNNVSVKTVSLYPNPVVDNLLVKSETEISNLVVTNLIGQNVKSITVNGSEKSVDLSDLPSGNYFMSVKLSSGLVSTHKFVKL